MPAKDISSVEGSAIMLGTIKKEQFFTAIFAKRAAERFAATGDTGFRLNVKAIKPVAPAIGAGQKQRLSPDHGAKTAANLAALMVTLKEGQREPQAKSRLPRTAASEYGWYWKEPEAPIISQKPLAPAACARSGEVKYAEAFASVFMAGPLCVWPAPAPSCPLPLAPPSLTPHPPSPPPPSPSNKTQPICRTVERAGPASKK